MLILRNTKGIEIGNKARHLFTLIELGYHVPKLCVLPYESLITIANANQLVLNDAVIEEIAVHLGVEYSYAVRSSANAEDSLGKSFAGQFSTKLNVKKEDLKMAIQAVWQSTQSNNVVAYNTENIQIELSIIIQQCIEADVSGVVFSANPATNDKETSVVSSVYGLGEGLVSGALDADLFYVKNQKVNQMILAEKSEKFIYGQVSDIEKVNVSPEAVNVASLKESEVLEIAGIAKALEVSFNGPQDIEFCIKNSQLYLLQSRPITTLKNENTDYLIWDNSNIIESYPGISLPLTFSFISPVYAAVYRQFCAILGINDTTIEANRFTFDNMLGLLKGRVYYNLYSWYKLLSLLPGYSLNAGFMEKMMGVSEKFELKDYKTPNGFVEKVRVFKLICSMVGNAIRLKKMRQSFLLKFNQVLAEHKLLNIPQADAFTCMMAYYKFEYTLSKEWKAPLVNDFFAMIYYGLFQKFVTKYANSSEINLNQFLIHTGQVITTEPAIWQQRIALIIQENSQLCLLFDEKNEAEIWQWLESHKTERIAILINEYLDKWGNRCFEELKLETITYAQDPYLFIKLLKQTYAFSKIQNTSHAELKLPSMPWFRKFVFNFLKHNAIQTVASRENLRFERTRAFAEVRFIFSRIGVLFHQSNVIEQPRDIFYLSKEEIFHFIKGTSIQLNLKGLIDLRKHEYETYKNEVPQTARIRTTGIVYNQVFEKEVNGTDLVLKGLPCCPGIVRARIKIIHSPNDVHALDGKILVTISTDPGWVAVFPLVKGILVQRGSVLSHAAIVSREMNIPCIVGIKNITTQLQDNAMIEMNGATGEITIIEE
ncbi:MAG: PEP/pyruvate-binding domain-containing protein [bacterium]|nr:PEP/pyruvate-binding domain-containing protein [bacterium]